MESTKTILLSKQGMKDLKKTIASLEHDREELIKNLHDLDKTDGHDERLERNEKLLQLETIEADLIEQTDILQHAKLFPRKRDALRVAMGSVVDLIDTSGRLVRYTLVDSIEANPSDGRISIKSPLGQNLIGKQLQDVVEWSAGLRTNKVRLVAIS
jgi:transcription elongation factor GreA